MPLAPDARTLLRTGGAIIVFGLLCTLLTVTVFGGVGIHGPHTNAGWLAVMFAIAALPFGLMIFSLGLAKWLFRKP
jgi:hypothetical protein